MTSLSRLSPQNEERLALVEKSLLDLAVNKPEKLAKQLSLRAGRVQLIVRHLQGLEDTLSPPAINTLFRTRAEGRSKNIEAQRLREATIPPDLLTGTGSDKWGTFWEAARVYSEEIAYPGHPFPMTKDGAHCVLCQQVLDAAGSHRLEQFKTFVASTIEADLRMLRRSFQTGRKGITELDTNPEAVEQAIKEIAIDHEEVAAVINAALTLNEKRRQKIVAALQEDKDLEADCPALVVTSDRVQQLHAELQTRIETLGKQNLEEARKAFIAEAQ